ncbi:MAG: hypothetical protein VX265_04830 [Myxococcota bacterium]|nr:hypothetical protein [Myxococcota bacterium]MEC8423415.1 hypothetical protein [Myxococcota bacterium]
MLALILSLSLGLGPGGPALLSSPALAVSPGAWYVGEWKTAPQDGLSIAVRFGANGKGMFGIYQDGKPVQSFNIVYTRAGDHLVFSRNGVEMKFLLDETAGVIKTGGGVAMARVSAAPAAAGGCEEACWAANASQKALQDKYGTSSIPVRFQHAVALMEGPGYAAYQACAKPHGMKALTDPIIGEQCDAAATGACVAACEKAR